MPLSVSTHAIAKAFSGKPVLKGVSLEVPAGRSTVLIGPSASGKSVLIRLILGLADPDAGTIRVSDGAGDKAGDGAGDTQDRHLEQIGVLFQQDALFDSMTVWENVAFQLTRGLGMPRPLARERALSLLAEVGLAAGVAQLYPVELSGGMKKRVAITRAMACRPELLILDDPTAGLDPIMTNAVLTLIDRYRAETGATILAISGDMKAARSRFDRIAMLHDGVIQWAGDTADAGDADNPYLSQMLDGRAEGPIRMQLRA